MDELDQARDISLPGPEAEEALAKFKSQLTKWDLVMPPAEPLVLDFGLGDFAKFGLIEYWIANEDQAGYCGKFLFVFDGQTCPMHRHRRKMETFFIVKGKVRLTCAGTEHELGPGNVLPVRPGTDHRFTGLGPALLLEISMPCHIEDNYFQDSRVPFGGNYRKDTAADHTTTQHGS